MLLVGFYQIQDFQMHDNQGDKTNFNKEALVTLDPRGLARTRETEQVYRCTGMRKLMGIIPKGPPTKGVLYASAGPCRCRLVQ